MMQNMLFQSITFDLCVLVVCPGSVSRKLALQAASRAIDEKGLCEREAYDCTFGRLLDSNLALSVSIGYS